MNIPSYNALLDRVRQIKTIQELCGIVGGLEKKSHPSKVSELANDKGFITADEVPVDERVGANSEALLKANQEIYTLKKAIGSLGGDVTYELPNVLGTGFNTLMNNNGTVKLTEDVTTSRFGPGIMASNKVTLDLNNHNLIITGLTSTSAGILARGSEEITIKGKGTIDTGGGICVLCNSADAVVNLSGSTTIYQTNRPGAELIYCQTGTINISGGTFKNNGSPYLLNCLDANYKSGKANIVVTGGKFYDFNPGDNGAEGEHTSFLAEGYIVTSAVVTEEDGEHTVYTVKKA